METPLMLTCPEGDTGQECAVDFFSLWVSFMCYVCSGVLVWCFQIASAWDAKRQQMVAFKAKQ